MTPESERLPRRTPDVLRGRNNLGGTFHQKMQPLDSRLNIGHTGFMTITEAALVMISDCRANGAVTDEDILDYILDDELNEVVIEAARLVRGGFHNE